MNICTGFMHIYALYHFHKRLENPWILVTVRVPESIPLKYQEMPLFTLQIQWLMFYVTSGINHTHIQSENHTLARQCFETSNLVLKHIDVQILFCYLQFVGYAIQTSTGQCQLTSNLLPFPMKTSVQYSFFDTYFQYTNIATSSIDYYRGSLM